MVDGPVSTTDGVVRMRDGGTDQSVPRILVRTREGGRDQSVPRMVVRTRDGGRMVVRTRDGGRYGCQDEGRWMD